MVNQVLKVEELGELKDLGFRFPDKTIWMWSKQLKSWDGKSCDPNNYELIPNESYAIMGFEESESIPTLTGPEILDILPEYVNTYENTYDLEIFKSKGKLRLRYMKGLMGEPLIDIEGDSLIRVCFAALRSLLKYADDLKT